MLPLRNSTKEVRSMPAIQRLRNGLLAAGAIGALAFGGSTLARAATGSSGNDQGATTHSAAPSARPDPNTPGGHVGANGKAEQALSAAVAAKVKAAAAAKVPGGTVERVETDVDHGSPYEAHVRKADGTELECSSTRASR
jgi:hypothetical protein